MHPRCGQLSRKSELLGIAREVHFGDISFRVYRFCPEILRGQPDFHDMPPAFRAYSRNQYAPVIFKGREDSARVGGAQGG